MKGKLISFEGGNGTGKSTQIEKLEDYLKGRGFEVVCTREPGGIELAESIRYEVKHPSKTHTPEGEVILFSCARYLHMLYKIKPALESGKIVITDRLHDSTIAYQGHGRDMNLDFVKHLQEYAIMRIRPHLTIYIDADPGKALEKIDTSEYKGQADRFEIAGVEYLKKVREGYLVIAKEEPDRVKVINYRDGDIDGMQNEIRVLVDKILGEK